MPAAVRFDSTPQEFPRRLSPDVGASSDEQSESTDSPIDDFSRPPEYTREPHADTLRGYLLGGEGNVSKHGQVRYRVLDRRTTQGRAKREHRRGEGRQNRPVGEDSRGEEFVEKKIGPFAVAESVREESIVALQLHLISRHPLPTALNPNPEGEVVAVLTLSLSPSAAKRARFKDAFLQVEFTAPDGVQVVEFAPQDWQDHGTEIQVERATSASATANMTGPSGAGSVGLSLQTRWQERFSMTTTSRVTGVQSDKFTLLTYSFTEDRTPKLGLDRHHQLMFKLDRAGDIEARVHLRAALVGSRSIFPAQMTIGKRGKGNGEKFSFRIPSDV